MTGEPLLLILVTCAGILATEAIACLGRCFMRLVPGQAALVVIPLAVRMALFALVTAKLITGLIKLQHALELLNGIAP